MKIKIKEDESEFIIDPEDRDLIITANKELEHLDDDKKELIKSIIEHNLSHCDTTRPNPNLPTSISKSIGTLLCPESTVFLFNLMSNPDHIKVTLDKLKVEHLIGENASKFILNLTVKYGADLHNILLTIERPHDWLRIVSNALITDDTKLHSKIWRMDGEIFQFNVPLRDSVILAEHFVRRTLEIITLIDKERVLELDEDHIDKLEKRVTELRELYESVKSEIEKIEHPEENTPASE